VSPATRKILILGGYGVFGGRLAELLQTDARLSLIVAGRSVEKACAACASMPAKATVASGST
jgi:saccharopine dehydrogenase-like NADP-dependent oxidoreductase